MNLSSKAGLYINFLLLNVLKITFYAIGILASFTFSKIAGVRFPRMLTTGTAVLLSFLSDNLAKRIHQKLYHYKTSSVEMVLRKRIEVFWFASTINTLLLIALAILLSLATHQSLRTVAPAIGHIVALFAGLVFFFIGLLFVSIAADNKETIQTNGPSRRVATCLFLSMGIGFLLISLLALIGGLLKTKEFIF